MLPCVCLVIDHKWYQNAVRTKKSGTRGDSRVYHWCSYHILTSSVIYYWRDARQHGMYLFYIIKFLYHQNLSTWLESRPLPALRPLWQTRKKAIWRNLLSIQMKQPHWLLCVAKKFWLVQENHATVKLDSSVAPRGMKLTGKAKLNCEIYKYWRKWWENRDSFRHQSSPVSWIAWTLPWILQELKSKLGKVAFAINTGCHSIGVLNERSVSDGGNLCPLWLEILKSVRYSWL